MPQVTHVKKAQQRYETKPVLNEDGTPKQTPVMRGGEQRVTKRGVPVFMSVTVADKTQPLPPEECDFCKEPIEVGTAYKHMTPKSGPYGGSKRSRHEDCPTWQVWEYSSSLSARVAQIEYDATLGLGQSEDSVDEFTDVLTNAAEAIRELANEKEESASNIEDGFGHETTTSAELREQAEALNGWADDVEAAEIPDLPEPEEGECEDCGGNGEVDDEDAEVTEDNPEPRKECEKCGGTGQFTPDEPTEDQMNEWRDEATEAVTSVLGESPV